MSGTSQKLKLTLSFDITSKLHTQGCRNSAVFPYERSSMIVYIIDRRICQVLQKNTNKNKLFPTTFSLCRLDISCKYYGISGCQSHSVIHHRFKNQPLQEHWRAPRTLNAPSLREASLGHDFHTVHTSIKLSILYYSKKVQNRFLFYA